MLLFLGELLDGLAEGFAGVFGTSVEDAQSLSLKHQLVGYILILALTAGAIVLLLTLFPLGSTTTFVRGLLVGAVFIVLYVVLRILAQIIVRALLRLEGKE